MKFFDPNISVRNFLKIFLNPTASSPTKKKSFKMFAGDDNIVDYDCKTRLNKFCTTIRIAYPEYEMLEKTGPPTDPHTRVHANYLDIITLMEWIQENRQQNNVLQIKCFEAF